jgi:hypothetical protein
MSKDQQPTERKLLAPATRRGRVLAAWILAAALAVCVLLVLAAANVIDITRYLAPCGMKMRYGLPCPTCGFTTASLAFFSGRIFEAFYIQPAAALLCIGIVLTVFLSFITAAFGVYFPFLKRRAERIKAWHIVAAVFVILGAAWLVTLSRALAQRGQ